jgi:hypothetical protein
VITKDEAKKIRARWEELKSETEGFVRASEEGAYGAVKAEAKSEPKSEPKSVAKPTVKK